jgi:hypothetical protein
MAIRRRIDAGVGVVTIATSSSQTTDRQTTYFLTSRWQYAWAVPDGTHWLIKGAN